MDNETVDKETLVSLTADIVSAHVANNTVAVGDVEQLLRNVHAALGGLANRRGKDPEPKTPAVSVRASVKPDHLVCLECGSKQTMLRRHIRVAHDMTPEEYRREFKLPADYPMSAPDYSERRSQLAKEIGLGRKPADKPKQAAKKTGGGRKKAGGKAAAKGSAGSADEVEQQS